MGIKLANKNIKALCIEKTPILKVYLGRIKVFELNTLIPSCFSNGYWIDEYEWKDNSLWGD